jgi:hypothetical protein
MKTTKTTEILQANAFQHEILELVSKQRSNSKKVEILKTYRNPGLVSILIMNFDESVQSILPPGEVPLDFDDSGSIGGNTSELINSKARNSGNKTGYYGAGDFQEEKSKTSIRKEYRIFYNFCKNGNPRITQLKKESMFINLLRGLHPKEAELLCLVKDKKLTDKYKITFENVKNAFPDIQWGGRS